MKTKDWRTKEVLQHGGSTLGSIILRGTFRRISQQRTNLNLGELSSSFIVYNITDFLLYPLSVFFIFSELLLFAFAKRVLVHNHS